MPRYSTDDIVELKKREKRKKRLKKFLVLFIFIIVAVVLYYTRQYWNPKLRDLGKQYQTIINDGELADGNFPITINGGNQFQLQYTRDTPVVLSDAYIYFYSNDGLLLKRRQHTYSNTLMKTAGGKALLFESGGKSFSVEDEDNVLYKDSMENNIMFARISEEGYSAIVTTSVNYDCEVFVYNNNGKVVYERKCMKKVSDISFVKESTGCIISYVYADNGEFVTDVQSVDFSQSEEVWTSPPFNTFSLNVNGFSDGAFVLGIDACGYIDDSGKINSYYSYDGNLEGGDSSNGLSAIIVNNDERRKYTAVLFSEGGTNSVKIEFEQPLIDVIVSDELAFIMCQGSVKAYDFEGNLHSVVQITDSYTGFVRSEKYIFLKSYNKIDRIDYDV